MTQSTSQTSSSVAVQHLPPLLNPYRPWFSLYNVRLKASLTREEDDEVELALIQALLPDEVLHHVFLYLPIMDVARVQCVCRHWRDLGDHQELWQRACQYTFSSTTAARNTELMRTQYHNCWKTMLLDRTHVRFDGVYVSRNSYIRTGVVEWETRNAVHMVLFFRYMRFFPDGTFVYRTSPELPSKVCKLLQMYSNRPSVVHGLHPRKAAEGVFVGRWKQQGDRVYTALHYDNNARSELRSKLRLRSTVRGANNLMDIQQIVTFDREDGTAQPLPLGDAELGGEEGVERRESRRGLTPYKLVTWDKITTTELNLPVSQLDYYLPG